jgi:hypothetical protein
MSETQITKRRYPVGVDHPQFKHGGRSKYQAVVRQQLREKIDRLDGTDVLDLEEEALLLRAVLMDLLERDKATDSDTQRIVMLIDQITRTAERMTRMRNDTAITAAEVKLISARLADVVTRYITDPNEQARFMAEVFSIGIGG